MENNPTYVRTYPLMVSPITDHISPFQKWVSSSHEYIELYAQ